MPPQGGNLLDQQIVCIVRCLTGFLDVFRENFQYVAVFIHHALHLGKYAQDMLILVKRGFLKGYGLFKAIFYSLQQLANRRA